MPAKGTKKRVSLSREELVLIVEETCRRVLDQQLKSLLHDVDYRIRVLADTVAGDRVSSHQLNLATHILDGYTFTNNSPQAGYVSWAGCHIVYKGIDYTISDGNTNKKYIYWTLDTPTQFQTSDTPPNLSIDDVLVGINDGGTFHLMMSPGRMVHGAGLVSGTVGSTQIADAAITASKILDGAVTGPKVASGAIGGAHIASGAVTGTHIATGAVTGTHIASKAVGNGHLADAAVTGDKIATGAVGSNQLADGAVTGPKIGAGAVATSKLNLAQHLLY